MRTVVCKLCRQHPPSPHPGMIKGWCVQCSLTSRRLRGIHKRAPENGAEDALREARMTKTCHIPDPRTK